MDSPENNIGDTISNQKKSPSLLDQIIETSHNSVVASNDISSRIDSALTPNTNPIVEGSNNLPLRKLRDPMTTATVLKLIWSLLLVAIIFFGSFLAYIAFNPDQAAFFVNIFGINPNDIQTLLKNLINGSFGITVLIFSIVWIVSLFRAIWIPRDQKRRRIISWFTAGIFGIFLFLIIAFWAYLFGIINATDYANPGGNVTIYDNDLYTNAISREYAQIGATNNLIWPITLRYDISTNAKAIAKKNLLTIESYEINFDGAKCANEKSVITGSDPMTEQWLICTFDRKDVYNLQWTYSGRDRLGELHTIVIPLDTVEIKGLIEISTNINIKWEKLQTINASKIKNLWNPRWLSSTAWSIEKTSSSITEVISNIPLIICFKIFDTKSDCDRFFLIMDTDTNSKEWSIIFEQDSTNTLGVIMSLTWITINKNEIVAIEWLSEENTRMCQWINESCRHIFSRYGLKNVTATVLLANGKKYPIEWSYTLNEPLLLAKHVLVLDQDGKILNTPDTIEPTTWAYIIKDILAPTNITLDARDVVTENPGYDSRDIIWKISHGKIIEEKRWKRIDFSILKTERYTIEVTYIFEKNIVMSEADIRTTYDTIIIDLEHRTLEPILAIQKTASDYVPVIVTVDASSSRSKNSEIKKFIFDFGEWKPETEWDAIQTYEYKTSGVKVITLTIVDSNNERASITDTVVLKDSPKIISFTMSRAPVISVPIDFISDWSNQDVEEWIWNFGDNTPTSKWFETTHTFNKPGEYNVTLTVVYINWTQRSKTQSIQVVTSIE